MDITIAKFRKIANQTYAYLAIRASYAVRKLPEFSYFLDKKSTHKISLNTKIAHLLCVY
jgi:hypothetical protein